LRESRRVVEQSDGGGRRGYGEAVKTLLVKQLKKLQLNGAPK
jgi:hypothetical protein